MSPTAASTTTNRSTEMMSPPKRIMPEKADGTDLSSTPKESCAPAWSTHRRPRETMNALSVFPRRCRKISRSDTSPTSPTTTMARSSVRR